MPCSKITGRCEDVQDASFTPVRPTLGSRSAGAVDGAALDGAAVEGAVVRLAAGAVARVDSEIVQLDGVEPMVGDVAGEVLVVEELGVADVGAGELEGVEVVVEEPLSVEFAAALLIDVVTASGLVAGSAAPVGGESQATASPRVSAAITAGTNLRLTDLPERGIPTRLPDPPAVTRQTWRPAPTRLRLSASASEVNSSSAPARISSSMVG